MDYKWGQPSKDMLYAAVSSTKATQDIFHEMDWDVAILWQLQGLHGIHKRYIAVTSSAVSESRLSNPSPSPSHHLKVRVRVSPSESESESESNLIFFSPSFMSINYEQQEQQQNVSNVRVNSATRHGRYCLDSGVTRARVTISESESESESK